MTKFDVQLTGGFLQSRAGVKHAGSGEPLELHLLQMAGRHGRMSDRSQHFGDGAGDADGSRVDVDPGQRLESGRSDRVESVQVPDVGVVGLGTVVGQGGRGHGQHVGAIGHSGGQLLERGLRPHVVVGSSAA